jgi:hypothetical protein
MTTKDVLTVGLALVSLIVTIGWNLQNRSHTNRIARQIRVDSYALDEWKELRSEVLRALRDLEEAAGAITVLSTGGHSRDELLAEINKEAFTLTRFQLRLTRELERASPPPEPDWKPLAYGRVHEDESDWDRLNSVLADLADVADPDEIRKRLVEIGDHVRGIANLVNEQIRARNASHDPYYAER